MVGSFQSVQTFEGSQRVILPGADGPLGPISYPAAEVTTTDTMFPRVVDGRWHVGEPG